MSGGPISASSARRSAGVAAAGLLLAACSGSSPGPYSNPYPMPSGPGWRVTAVTQVAPREGAPVVAGRLVWVPDMSGGEVVAVDVRSGAVQRRVRVGDPGVLLRQGCGTSSVHATPHGSFDIRRCDVPNAIAYDGKSLWLPLNDARVLVRLDPVSGRNLATIPLGVEAFGVAAGPTGIWVTDFQHDSVVHFAGNGAEAASITNLPPGPSGVAVGSDAVWIACARAGSIVRVDPSTNKVVAEVPLFKSPLAVTIAFGSVWVRSEEGDILTRIDPATNAVLANIPVGAAEGLDGLDQFGVDATGLWLGGLQIAHVSATTNTIDRKLSIDGEALDYGAGYLWAVGLIGRLTRVAVS